MECLAGLTGGAMLNLIAIIVVMFLFFFVWIFTIAIIKSKQLELPLLLIYTGIALLSSGTLGYLDYDLFLDINTEIGSIFGYIKNPETNFVLLGCGITLIVLGTILWHSLRKRIYILNMLGKIKHEISDVKTINSLRLKDYQLKETVLDLRWAAIDINQQKWEQAKTIIEEYIVELSARSDSSTICFTGMAPIPFEIYAGRCMYGHTVSRFFEYKRSEDSYYELTHQPFCSSIKWPKNKNIPILKNSTIKGDNSAEVVIAVSITQSIQDSDLVQFNCPIIRLGIDNPKDNALTSIMQLKVYVNKTNELIIGLKNAYPDLTCVHLVCAVPSCYAFDLGCKIGHLDNRLPEIVVHHYVSTSSPKYKYGIVVTGENRGNLIINN